MNTQISNLSNINVAILAGGRGIRLASIFPRQQKVVVKISKHPFLEYILNQLNKTNFKNIVICTGYLNDQVKEVLGDNYQNLHLSYSYEHSPLGTAGAVAHALPLLKSDNILITNGDSFIDCDLQSFYDFHLKKKANGSIILTEVDETGRFGKVDTNENDEIVDFEEKVKNGGRGFVNGGVYIIKKNLLLEIPKKGVVSFEKEMFPSWVDKGLYGFKTKGRFIDIGTPESLHEAEEFFSKNLI